MLLIKKANINGTGTIADILIDENGKSASVPPTPIFSAEEKSLPVLSVKRQCCKSTY